MVVHGDIDNDITIVVAPPVNFSTIEPLAPSRSTLSWR
jgi:hypothetical protein